MLQSDSILNQNFIFWSIGFFSKNSISGSKLQSYLSDIKGEIILSFYQSVINGIKQQPTIYIDLFIPTDLKSQSPFSSLQPLMIEVFSSIRLNLENSLSLYLTNLQETNFQQEACLAFTLHFLIGTTINFFFKR